MLIPSSSFAFGSINNISNKISIFSANAFAAEKLIQTVALTGNEGDAALLGMASNVVPSPRQVAYHKEEFIGFIHFGPNTFTGKEWGNGMEDAKAFAPDQVDTEQWCKTLKDAGMTKLIITVKHHDGYCTWQTRYNKHFSIHQSPWKGGKGAVLRLLSESCRKHGLKLGVYLSPADLFQISMASATSISTTRRNPPIPTVSRSSPPRPRSNDFRHHPTSARTPRQGVMNPAD